MTTVNSLILGLAQALYKEYGDSADWQDPEGESMLVWEYLPEAIQGHWLSVAALVNEQYALKEAQPTQLSITASVRAKFTCNFKSVDDQTGAANINFSPVYTGSEENTTFWNATPAGYIEMNITNPQAFDKFEPGKEYYVDFTLAN